MYVSTCVFFCVCELLFTLVLIALEQRFTAASESAISTKTHTHTHACSRVSRAFLGAIFIVCVDRWKRWVSVIKMQISAETN